MTVAEQVWISGGQRPHTFMPSIARDVEPIPAYRQGDAKGVRHLAAAWALQVSLYVSALAPTNPVMASILPVGLAERPAALRPGTVSRRTYATAQEMVRALKESGLPISAMSDFTGVERKTIYSWLDDGVHANSVNHARLQLVYSLLSEAPRGSLRFYHRFSERVLPEGKTLKALLSATEINETDVRDALSLLRPVVDRAMQATAAREENSRVISPASHLALNLRAGA